MPEAKKGQSPRFSNRILPAVLIIVLAVGIGFLLYSNHSLTLQGSLPSTNIQLASAAAGSSTNVMCEIISTSTHHSLQGYVLERTNDGSYARTQHIITVTWQSDQNVNMGHPQDLQPGAIVQISGQVDQAKVLHANQISVVTNYLKVK
ncbi:hypothetical protein KDW_37480 [Dictyobacter vulcani]|uniref:DUF5666 domain-containing protein n=1 Tax=Dictyobacter vulcani TaxID=2607529 RepID=A0A5J4KWK2_9CHLR|nr:hypothetical protein [Dictyobacter vulcani]GER89586.1 hypothetical protein KDW_37480 [Dictyobacter vulcani]